MTPPRLVEAADELLRFLDANGLPACLIGGIVVSRWGEPRATKDVDATVLADFSHEAAVLDLLLSKFASRDPDPDSFASGADDSRRFWRSRTCSSRSRPRFESPGDCRKAHGQRATSTWRASAGGA